MKKIEELVKPSQRTSSVAIANQIKDIKEIAKKVESFQEFLDSESNRFQQYLKELGIVMEFKLTNDIYTSAERAGVNIKKDTPAPSIPTNPTEDSNNTKSPEFAIEF